MKNTEGIPKAKSGVFNSDAVGNVKRVVIFILFVYCHITIGSLSSHAREIPIIEVTATEIDYALRDALLAGDFHGFSGQLALGGDPTAWFENSHKGWVLCTATQPGREKYLQQLIDNDFDINYLQSNTSSLFISPLSCAVTFDNFQALEMLVAAGADPALRPCLKCFDRSPMSTFAETAALNKYDFAVWLLDKGDYSDEQIATVIYMIDTFPINEKNRLNNFRLELVERLRNLGFEVSPWTRDLEQEQPSMECPVDA